MRVTAPLGDLVRLASHRLGLHDLLSELPSHRGQDSAGPRALCSDPFTARSTDADPTFARCPGPLLSAALLWIHETLRHAGAGLIRRSGDIPGLTGTAAALLELLAAPREE